MEDVAEEGRAKAASGRRAGDDAGQAQRHALDRTAPNGIGKGDFDHALVCAIDAGRGGRGGVIDGRRQRTAEHRDRPGKDQAAARHRLDKGQGHVQIDRARCLRIAFRCAAGEGGEMQQDVGFRAA
ncbi:hypothetical protein BF95_23405 [Sphingobium sp. Ant17]|nr:hypothetical protein BF95_23405 [Sphingobium sp. Ant17]